MIKTFSTKLNIDVLKSLDRFCVRFHLKKSSFLEEIIAEGVRRHTEVFELAKSIERGLLQEKDGLLSPADEVEERLFGK